MVLLARLQREEVQCSQQLTRGDRDRRMEGAMRALVQRVSYASVTVDQQIVAQIEQGLLVLLGIGQGDTETEVKTLVEKIIHLRIFEDEAGKMNRSLLDIHGEIL